MSNIILKELYIDNFKSFKNSKFTFGKVNCLVAPNNAGKSNLIEVFELLDKAIFNNFRNIFNGDVSDKRNYKYNQDIVTINAKLYTDNLVCVKQNLIKYQITTNIEIKINYITLKYSLNVKNNGKIKGMLISDNKADIRKYNKDIKLDNLEEYLVTLHKKRFIKINENDEKTHPLFNLLIEFISANENNIDLINKNLFGTNNLFSSFYFHPQTIKKQQNYETNFLLKDGTNIAYILDSIDNETFSKIQTSIIWEVELIESIDITQGSIPTIVFNENVNGNIQKIIYQKVSDGTIHFLALLTALNTSKSNCLIFEEPERHLHMKILYKLINHFKESDKQIFFTTHSTEMLNNLKLDEIIFLYRDDDGNTQGKRAKDIQNIKKIMKIYKNDLVELIQVGIFDDLALEDNI